MQAVAEPASMQAQINVRLDRSLKEAGDRELELMGASPSQAVRALWKVLAKGGSSADAIREVLFEDEGSQEVSPSQQAKLDALDAIDHMWDDFAAELGADLSTFVPMTDDELEDARSEYLLGKYGE